MNSSDTLKKITALLDKLDSELDAELDDNAISTLEGINDALRDYCEKELLSKEHLVEIQNRIHDVLGKANKLKENTFNTLLKHKKSSKAITAYKAI